MAVVALLYAAPLAGDPSLLLIRALHGVAFASFFTAFFTWAADYPPPDRLAEGIGQPGAARPVR